MITPMTPTRDETGHFPAYAWPGGYPIFYMLADDVVLCPACANGRNGSDATTEPGTDAQWRIVASDCNWEDPDLYCEHCNGRIESAYAEKDNES